MKKLHEFTIDREVEIEETEITKDDKGQDVKTIKKVKKNSPQRFFIAKPTRSLYDEADLYYGVKLSEGIQAGLLTRQLLAKRYANDGGAMSEPEKQEYTGLYVQVFDKQNEYQKIAGTKKEADRTEEEKNRLNTLIKELNELRQQIQEFELAQISLFDQTAESRARNKTILWWVLNLSYTVDANDKEELIFGSGSLDKRLEKYDEIMEANEEHLINAVNKFVYFISFWYMGRAAKSEDFVALEKADLENKNQ